MRKVQSIAILQLPEGQKHAKTEATRVVCTCSQQQGVGSWYLAIANAKTREGSVKNEHNITISLQLPPWSLS